MSDLCLVTGEIGKSAGEPVVFEEYTIGAVAAVLNPAPVAAKIMDTAAAVPDSSAGIRRNFKHLRA